MEKDETYRQRSFFQTGMPLFVVALFFLIAALCFCLKRGTLLLAVVLLVIGLLFLMLGAGRVKKETKNILRFVQESSVFYHRCYPPLRVTDILDCLKKEGFEVAAYPFGNYYCHRNIGQKFGCHFFIANNDTPDCPEAESYSELFIRIVCESGMSLGSQYLLDMEYGARLEQKSPEYIQAVREGFMHNKQGVPFGFRLAYDTQGDILYCAEAIVRIIWHKSDPLAIYVSELLKKLFFEQDRRQDVIKEENKGWPI